MKNGAVMVQHIKLDSITMVFEFHILVGLLKAMKSECDMGGLIFQFKHTFFVGGAEKDSKFPLFPRNEYTFFPIFPMHWPCLLCPAGVQFLKN